MNLRDEIATIIVETCLFDNEYDGYDSADQILALIEGQRCEWRWADDGYYDTACGQFARDVYGDYCHCCGKRIEVKG